MQRDAAALKAALADLEQRSLKRTRRVMPRDDLINFCSNDYLGLAQHPEVVRAFSRAEDRTGHSSDVDEQSPYAFEVVQSCHTPASFVGRRRFIQEVEQAVQGFYWNIGRHLSAWTPKPPAPSEKTPAALFATA